MPGFDDSTWSSAIVHTEEEAGWGIAPLYGLPTCGKATNPLTRVEMGPIEGYALNYNSSIPTLSNPWKYAAEHTPMRVTLTQDECLVPQEVFSGSLASFVWGESLKLDNRVLFRFELPPVA